MLDSAADCVGFVSNTEAVVLVVGELSSPACVLLPVGTSISLRVVESDSPDDSNK